MILPENKNRHMDNKKKKTGKAAAARGLANKKGRHTSTQATGPKRQAIEPAAGKSDCHTNETDNGFGMRQD
jgi:hypothetical protein